jgi:uncharacterized protein YacL
MVISNNLLFKHAYSVDNCFGRVENLILVNLSLQLEMTPSKNTRNISFSKAQNKLKRGKEKSGLDALKVIKELEEENLNILIKDNNSKEPKGESP